MARKRTKNDVAAQEVLFQEPNAPPNVPPEVVAEVLAALADLLLEAASPNKTEVADEREGL